MEIDKTLSILGCRGIPGNYGGFETFAERLALYLTEKGWLVTVYCQSDTVQQISEEYWNGIRLIQVPSSDSGALASVLFDWKAVAHAARESKLVLTLGYNTAIFGLVYWVSRVANLINMDGMEWRRQKWKLPEKLWLYMNEWLGCWIGTHLIADHPAIKEHLSSRVAKQKITVIPYCEDPVEEADAALLKPYNLVPNEYVLIIARPEPENHILEIVSAFSSHPRGYKLVILGNYRPKKFPYHQQVVKAAGEEVVFLGAIYDKASVAALRYYARLYVHGHAVGGTNPSLVEALAAGSAVLAHNNPFTRWVAGPGAHYFNHISDCSTQFDRLLDDSEELQRMRQASLVRYWEEFSEQRDLKAYEALLTQYAVRSPSEQLPDKADQLPEVVQSSIEK
ncbi:DUF1972 domain-containing protein [Leptolyngbya sp. AN03gr2]|uniref:DUF1972 domain-containing protein n=1 Tax=unclassified Leptolyngbya TaxID=2650499 RepID=UPI003D31F235